MFKKIIKVVPRENPQGVGFFLASLKKLVLHEKNPTLKISVLPADLLNSGKHPEGWGFFSG